MNLILPINDLDNYSSKSQKIRVSTENWVRSYIFCPNCGDNLNSFKNNKPVADFYCKKCLEEYELKSKNGKLGKKIVAGSYNSIIDRINSKNSPSFFFLSYKELSFKIKDLYQNEDNKNNFYVYDFFTIPKYFFVEEIIEKRNPLNKSAKRAGWIGCNILINSIPDLGKIFYIKEGKIQKKEHVLDSWGKTTFIKQKKEIESKGWLFDILKCIDKIQKKEFFFI